MQSICRNRLRFFLLGFAGLLLSVGFNNCGGFNAGHETSELRAASMATSGSCVFNGYTYEQGSSVIAYLSSSVATGQACVAETRTCQSGGWTGSYQYSSCDGGIPAACLFNGQTVPSGQGVTAYTISSAPAGQSCAGYAQFRGCSDGVLSGTASYASCVGGAPAACLFNGTTVPSGQGVTAYTVSSVPTGETCASHAQYRGCTDGILDGTASYASCQVAQAASCLFNGQTVPHGATVTAYQNSSVPAGQPCVSETRTCSNGALSGSFGATSCTLQRCTNLIYATVQIDVLIAGFGLAKDVPESDCLGFCSSLNQKGVCMFTNRNVGRRCTFYAQDDMSTLRQVSSPPEQDIKTALCN